MNVKKLYISVAFFYFWPIVIAEPVIRLTLLEDPDQTLMRVQKKIETKGTVGKMGFNHFVNASPVSGFFAMYAGMLAMSDNTGAISFLRRHAQPIVYVAITQNVEPVMRMENTVHHWRFVPDTAVAFYKLEAVLDKEGNRLVWNIQEMSIPNLYIIPAEAIVLFGDPAYFYFDTKERHAMYSESNIFLPPLYVKKGTNAVQSSLHLLSIRHFFGPLKPVVNQNGRSYRLINQP